MKPAIAAFAILALSGLCACGNDEPDEPNEQQTAPGSNLSVTINADGSTSNDAVFSQIDGTTFYLDYVKCRIVDSHLEIVGYDSIELPQEPRLYASVKIGGTTYKTRTIRADAFKYSHIQSAKLPNTITSIEDFAFYGCTALQSINLPESITSIDTSAFRDCTALQSINLPNSITSIESSTFQGCTSLQMISLPESITSIDTSAFRDCTALQSITFPKSLTSIGEYAFYNCPLKKVTFLSLNPPYLSSWTYTDFNSKPKAYVPAEALSDYSKWNSRHHRFSEILPIE